MTGSDGIFTGIRLKMVDDLLSRYDFHGWSRQEVEALLGEPIYESVEGGKYFIKYDLREGLNLLIFELDSQEHIVEYHIRTD